MRFSFAIPLLAVAALLMLLAPRAEAQQLQYMVQASNTVPQQQIISPLQPTVPQQQIVPNVPQFYNPAVQQQQQFIQRQFAPQRQFSASIYNPAVQQQQFIQRQFAPQKSFAASIYSPVQQQFVPQRQFSASIYSPVQQQFTIQSSVYDVPQQQAVIVQRAPHAHAYAPAAAAVVSYGTGGYGRGGGGYAVIGRGRLFGIGRAGYVGYVGRAGGGWR